MADERTQPDDEAAAAAANEAPPEEATVTDASTPVGEASPGEADAAIEPPAERAPDAAVPEEPTAAAVPPEKAPTLPDAAVPEPPAPEGSTAGGQAHEPPAEKSPTLP